MEGWERGQGLDGRERGQGVDENENRGWIGAKTGG